MSGTLWIYTYQAGTGSTRIRPNGTNLLLQGTSIISEEIIPHDATIFYIEWQV